jgi:hypothetical protein
MRSASPALAILLLIVLAPLSAQAQRVPPAPDEDGYVSEEEWVAAGQDMDEDTDEEEAGAPSSEEDDGWWEEEGEEK